MTENNNGKHPTVEFLKRVGIVAGALLAVISLSNVLGGFALRQAMIPITHEIQRQVEHERIARTAADSALARSLQETAVILAILERPPGQERVALLRNIKTARRAR